MNESAKYILSQLVDRADGNSRLVGLDDFLSVIPFDDGSIANDQDREDFAYLVDNGFVIEHNAGVSVTDKAIQYLK